jgi:hypothetical protein
VANHRVTDFLNQHPRALPSQSEMDYFQTFQFNTPSPR